MSFATNLTRGINYLIAGCILLVTSCSHQGNGTASGKITIATAANMQFAMEELTNQFTKNSSIDCDLVISSSGKLTAQIKQGAPFDIFVAANMKYPEEIFNSGLAETRPKIYAYGKLVLWSMTEGIHLSIDLLRNESVEHIAIANPKIAPYGMAATEVLNYYNLLDEVESKLVYGESIAQTNQFITTRSAEVGFTAMSVVLSPKIKGKGRWIALEDSTYTSIKQGAVLIKRENSNPEAQQFYDFLFSNEAKQVLKDFGYAVQE